MKKHTLSLLIIAVTLLFYSCTKSGDSSYSSNVSSNSTGGSLARFTLVGDYLYTINNQKLKTYNVSNPASPVLANTTTVGPDIETIFPFKDKLFIGSNQTMYVYSLSNPAKPGAISGTNYVIPFRARDPVVANDTLAYSSLRNSSGPGGTLNVTDIRNLQSPLVINRIPLSTSPYGLGLADTALYLCEHNAGLKVYSLKTSVFDPIVRKSINDGETYYDVIPSGNLLYTWIEGGNSIFNITDRMNPVQLSKTKN